MLEYYEHGDCEEALLSFDELNCNSKKYMVCCAGFPFVSVNEDLKVFVRLRTFNSIVKKCWRSEHS